MATPSSRVHYTELWRQRVNDPALPDPTVGLVYARNGRIWWRSALGIFDLTATGSVTGLLTAWTPTTAYIVGQEVEYLGLRFVANANHTSAASFFTDLSHWECSVPDGEIVNQLHESIINKVRKDTGGKLRAG